MKRYLPFILIVVVGAAALTGGFLIYRAKRAELTHVLAEDKDEVETSANRESAHMRGDEKASVTVEEFGDFQCPPCATLAAILFRIEHDYGSKLRVIFREFPLPMHVHAQEAAWAAEAAGLQGRFWEMHDLLYRNQSAWTVAPRIQDTFKEYALTLGLDVERFVRDYSSDQVKERVTADHAQGEARGVTATPSLFINGHNIPPASANELGLRAALDAAIQGRNASTPTAAPIK
jgi:protein-disulfide isomerase